jgi:hypothetical protein
MTGAKSISGKPFQILSLDLLIDEDHKVWLLELNDDPSLNIHFDKDYMSGKKPTDEDICPVDFHVKSRLVTDFFELCKKSKIESIDTWHSLSKMQGLETDSMN